MFAAENGLKGDPRLQAISEAIRVVPHFPKPGIMFQDITTLLLDPKAFKHTIDIFVDRYRDMNISVVAGEVIKESYELEYGTDCLEMHVGAVQPGERALIIDDLVATGGTLCAAIRLLGQKWTCGERSMNSPYQVEHLEGNSNTRTSRSLSFSCDECGVIRGPLMVEGGNNWEQSLFRSFIENFNLNFAAV
ncbi:Adenine phosphoribosyltransferase 5 [Bienertia sinuspersici]